MKHTVLIAFCIAWLLASTPTALVAREAGNTAEAEAPVYPNILPLRE